jgi:hypothetical protein
MESDEDVVKDLIGYLTLLLISLRKPWGGMFYEKGYHKSQNWTDAGEEL